MVNAVKTHLRIRLMLGSGTARCGSHWRYLIHFVVTGGKRLVLGQKDGFLMVLSPDPTLS